MHNWSLFSKRNLIFVGAHCQMYTRASEPPKIFTLKIETVMFAETLDVYDSTRIIHESRSCPLNSSRGILRTRNFIWTYFNVSKTEFNGLTIVLIFKYFYTAVNTYFILNLSLSDIIMWKYKISTGFSNINRFLFL
jgi:hypothetical protein